MGLFGRGLDYEPKGDYVTAKRVGKLGGVLADDERVEYLTMGSQITVNGEKKSGTSGFVRAAFTPQTGGRQNSADDRLGRVFGSLSEHHEY